MVVDSSVLVAIILRESGAEALLGIVLDRESDGYLSSVSMLESAMVLSSRLGPSGPPLLDGILVQTELVIVPFDSEQAAVARKAYLRFGKGRHPAKLNLGDCCAYALAKTLDRPLLYKGRDFDLTDVKPVRAAS